MTHVTGPRARFVKRLTAKIMRDILASKASVTESHEAMHEVQMIFLHRLLEPFEKDCPTCPKRKTARR